MGSARAAYSRGPRLRGPVWGPASPSVPELLRPGPDPARPRGGAARGGAGARRSVRCQPSRRWSEAAAPRGPRGARAQSEFRVPSNEGLVWGGEGGRLREWEQG